jgi:hypothetical protein
MSRSGSITTLAFIIALTTGAFAQVNTNARVDALGGAIFPVEDINDVLINPAYANSYQGLVQGTLIPAGLASAAGPVFGITGAGDLLTLGTHLNTGDVSLSDFYTDADAFLGAINDFPDGGFPALPHLLLGLNLDAVTLGMDAYFLGRGYKQEVETTGGATPGAVESSAFIGHFGAIFGAAFDLNAMQLGARAGFGYPFISGENAAGTDFSSEKGFFLPVGVDAIMGLGALDLSLGALYQFTLYQLAQQPQGGAISRDPVNTYHAITPHIGAEATIIDNTTLYAQYAPSLTWDRSESDDETLKNTTFSRTHNLGGGLEASTGTIWIFDDMVGRAGLTYAFSNTTSWQTTSAAGTETETITRSPITSIGANPSVGLGLTKNRFGLDVHVNLGAWAGLISGPEIFKATATINFGDQAMGATAPAPSYSPTPSYETEPGGFGDEQQPEMEEEDEDEPIDDFSF